MKGIEQATKQLVNSIDNNSQLSPHLSIDPESNTPAVVGDPNEIPTHKGNYKIVFMYHPDEISDEDKRKMTFDKSTNHYLAEMSYENRHVKPLIRGKVVQVLTRIATKAKIVREDGYTSDLDLQALGQSILDSPEDIAELMKLILHIPESQLEYISPKSQIGFINQLFDNEPNILKESVNFLV